MNVSAPELVAAPVRRPLRRDVLAAARDVAGLCPGMFLLGVTFGLVVTRAGLAWWWAPLFSGLVFGGSLEFVLVAMVGAAAPLATIALTSFLIQGRHVCYALSFPLHRVPGRARRAYAMFALIDEAYALTASRDADELTGTRILEASLTGRRLAGPLLALGCAVVAHLVAPGQMLLVAMGAYGVLLLALRPVVERPRRA
jgi:predicted branched-subunit amino acid permease